VRADAHLFLHQSPIFAGASKFGVWFTDRDFERSRRFFGSDGQGLIGQLFRGQGYIWPSEIRTENTIQPDWNMRVKDGNFYVLTEEDWPDYLPIPDMEPARSLDELRAAVTPFVIEPIHKVPVEQRLKEALASGRGGGLPLMPLNCQEDYRAVAARMHELSPDQNVSGYLVRMQNYAWKVGDYQALNEMCTSEANPAVRGDFLTAAVGGFDEDYSSRLNGAVDARYQSYCRPFYRQCPEPIFEHAKAEYEEIMTILRSGDLQRGLQRTVVVSQLSADWKRYALIIGQYEVMSEACSGSLDAAIRDDFFAALDSATADQAAELDTMIGESYEKYSVALQESIERQPANEERLKCRDTDVKVYFCDPQSPWQRGSNENTNGLLRQYFPKGMDLSNINQNRLNAVARRLNERPRKTLEYRTPAERFSQCVASIG